MKTRYLVLFALPLEIALLSQPSWGDDKVTELLQRANGHFRDENPDLAYPLLQEALALDPFHEEVLHKLCLYYLKKDNLEEAQSTCQTLVDKHPGVEDYRLAFYVSHLRMIMPRVKECFSRQDFSCGIKYAKHLLDVDPSAPQSHSLIGTFYVGRNSDRQDRLHAVAHLNEAIRLHELLPPDHPFSLQNSNLAEVYTGLGITYSREKDYARGIENLEKAIEIDPTVPDAREFLEIARRDSAGGRRGDVVWLSIADILGID